MATTTNFSLPTVTELYDASNQTSGGSLFSSVLDLRTAVNALVTFAANTGTAPTVQCLVHVLYYHTASGTPPTAASASDGPTGWKTIYSVGSGIVANMKNSWNYRPPMGGYLCIEFGQSSTNVVACEAYATVTPSATST